MSAENPDQEVQSQVKHSPEVGQTGENEYAKLAKGAPHASEMTDSQAERANMWAEAGERADERLQTARQNLAEVESGQIPEGKSKYEAWEEAMSNVETEKARASDMAERRHNVMNVPEVQPVMSAEEAEAAAQSDHAQLERAVGAAIVRGATERHESGTATEARHVASDETVEDGPAPHGSAEERLEARAVVEQDQSGLQGRRTREVIGKVDIERPLHGMDDDPASGKYRALANEVIARMIGNKASANDILKKKDLGRDYSEQGIAEAMAAMALPFVEQADRAKMQGNSKRAEILMQAASDKANDVARAMDWEQGFRNLHAVGAEPSLNGVRYKPSKRPRNGLRGRSLFDRMGVTWKALTSGPG